MNLKNVIIVIIVVLCIIGCAFLFLNGQEDITIEERPIEEKNAESIVDNITDPESIPEGYIAVGYSNWSAEMGATVYIYKLDNGHDNYGFEYITVGWSTKEWGSSEYNKSIKEKGQLMWTDDVVEYIKRALNDSGYVAVPGEDTGLTFDEFSARFIMN